MPNPDDFEILAAVGKVHGVKSRILCIACYAPPNMGSLRAGGVIVYLSDLIAEAKRMLGDVLIVVSVDYNQWPFQDLLDKHPDLAEVDHGPTRLDRSIDRSFVNFPRAIVTSGSSAPLETEEGNKSDHWVAYFTATFESTPVKQVSYTYRAFTPRGALQFSELLARQTREDVLAVEGSDAKAEVKMDAMMDECFQWRTTTRREDEEPWVDDFLKTLWKRRRKVYDRDVRSPLWRRGTARGWRGS